MKSLLINIGLLLSSLIILFLGIEFLLRVTGLQSAKPNPPKIFMQSEFPDISYELIPNLKNEPAYKGHVSTNSLGFRGPEINTKNRTIAIFGDSIAFGYGVNDNETLDHYMRELIPERNVLNTAAPGYNLEMETAVYRERVKKLNPEVIAIVFYFNDLTGTIGILDDKGILRSSDWDPSQKDCRPIETGLLGYLPGKCWLDGHSAFYKAFKKAIDLRSSKQRKIEEQITSESKPEEDDVTNEQLADYSAQLDTFVSLMRENQKRIFVIWPDQFLHEPSRPKIKSLAEERGFEECHMTRGSISIGFFEYRACTS